MDHQPPPVHEPPVYQPPVYEPPPYEPPVYEPPYQRTPSSEPIAPIEPIVAVDENASEQARQAQEAVERALAEQRTGDQAADIARRAPCEPVLERWLPEMTIPHASRRAESEVGG